MRTAVILGGTGLIGRAVARRLMAAGWSVDVTGREAGNMPPDLAEAGGRFHPIERDDAAGVAALVGSGVDLLVDCLCFTSDHARRLVPLLADVDSTVMMSSKAVYVDARGNHVNSDVPPRFDGAIPESGPTMAPREGDHDSREGYGANKVAAEQTLLDSGRPVTVIRASKVHGDGASPAREWVFLRRVLDGRPAVVLAARGSGVDHTTAAANVAALVETVADRPGRRILNCADPDAPSGLDIARTVAGHVGHVWTEVLLENRPADGLGAHPWDAVSPIVLDMSAATALGYRPAGTYADTVAAELDWLVRQDRAVLDEHPFFARFLDYEAEDRCLASIRP